MTSLFLLLFLPIVLYTAVSMAVFMLLPLPALIATAVGALISIPVLYFFYRSFCRQTVSESGKSLAERRPVSSLCWILIIILGMTACISMNNLLELSGLPERFTRYAEVSKDLYAPAVPLQILCTVILIPAAEEFIFRGLAFAPLRTRLSFVPAALLSALFFGLYHGNMIQGIYAFLLGFLMAWLYEKTQTLLAPYLFHLAANLISVILTNSGLSFIVDINYLKITVAVTFITAVLAVLCLILISRNRNNKEELL